MILNGVVSYSVHPQGRSVTPHSRDFKVTFELAHGELGWSFDGPDMVDSSHASIQVDYTSLPGLAILKEIANDLAKAYVRALYHGAGINNLIVHWH